MNKKEILVNKDRKLASILQDFGFSFSDVNKMLRNKDIKVDGIATKQNITVCKGQTLTFFYSDQMLEKKYEKIFESDDAVIVYKYPGIETDGENGLENVLSAIAVHRLDRNTEGLLVFAKNENSANLLKKAIKNHKIYKFYLTEVVGEFKVDKTFNAYLKKNSKKAEVTVSNTKGKDFLPISTKIKSIKTTSQSSVLEIELLTGRTHQIRAHLAFLGHPIIGDGKYGKNQTNKKFHQNHQKLACFRLVFDDIGLESLNLRTFEKFPKWFV